MMHRLLDSLKVIIIFVIPGLFAFGLLFCMYLCAVFLSGADGITPKYRSCPQYRGIADIFFLLIDKYFVLWYNTIREIGKGAEVM